MKLSEYKNLALVLSGGGVKAAAFHIGACLALQEKGFQFAGGSKDYVKRNFQQDEMTFKTYVGSSAGSVVTTYLASGYDINTLVETFTKENPFSTEKSGAYLKPITYKDIFKVNISPKSLLTYLSKFLKESPNINGGLEVQIKRIFKMNGFFTTGHLEKYFAEHVSHDNDFKNLGAALFIVATQLNHSRKVVFGPFEETKKDSHIKYSNYAKISQAVAASTSLPPVFAPYSIPNNKGKDIFFFDGEIRDTLSTHVAADKGCDLIISSYSIHPYHYNSEMGSLHNYGVPMIINQALYQLIQQKISSSVSYRRTVNSIINSVEGFLKEQNFDKDKREQLIDILVERANIRRGIQYIYIHPSPQDYQMFFADHFSLKPSILNPIVRAGFKAAMAALRAYKI